MPFNIIRADITMLKVDAIVNAANTDYNGPVKQNTELKNEFPSDKLKQQTDGGKENVAKRANSGAKS